MLRCRRVVGLVSAAFILAAAFSGSAQAQSPYVPITCVEGASTFPVGINEAGDIVGFYYEAGSSRTRGFLLHKGGGCETLDYAAGDASAFHTWPMGINDRGQIVGAWTADQDGTLDTAIGFVYERGEFRPVLVANDVGEPDQTVLLGISNNGVIVGFCHQGSEGSGRDVALQIDADGTVHQFGATDSIQFNGINPRGEIVGGGLEGPVDRGFLRSPTGEMTVLDPVAGCYTMLLGINPQGDITGNAFEVMDVFETSTAWFLPQGGTWLSVAPYEGAPTIVGKINASGEMTVAAFHEGVWKAFIVRSHNLVR
jgi:hypothetical protein